MKPKLNLTGIRQSFTIILVSLIAQAVWAAPEDVDLTGQNPNPTYTITYQSGKQIAAGAGFGVMNATSDVYWEFASIPNGATQTATSFTKNGITVILPAPQNTAVPNTSRASYTGTPAGLYTSFTFIVTIADQNDASRIRNREYKITIVKWIVVGPILIATLILAWYGYRRLRPWTKK